MATFHLCEIKDFYESERRVVFMATRDNLYEGLSHVKVKLERVFNYPEEFSDLFEGPAEESEYHYIELIRESRDIESLIPFFLSMCLSEKKIREAKSILSTVGEPIIDGDVMYSKSDSSEDDYIMLRKYHLDNRVIRIYYGNNSQSITAVEVE